MKIAPLDAGGAGSVSRSTSFDAAAPAATTASTERERCSPRLRAAAKARASRETHARPERGPLAMSPAFLRQSLVSITSASAPAFHSSPDPTSPTTTID